MRKLITWVEIPATDIERAAKFYSKVLNMEIQVLDLPIKELFNYSIPLRLIIKDKVNQLEDDLSLAETFEQRIAIAENFLISQIRKNEKKYKYDRIRTVINHINEAKGILDIEELASKSFLSRKQFERTFSDFIGNNTERLFFKRRLLF